MTLENSIFEFVKDSNSKNRHVDSEDIVLQFRKRTDDAKIILKTIAKLQEAGRIKRKWLGFKYGYVAIEPIQDQLPIIVS